MKEQLLHAITEIPVTSDEKGENWEDFKRISEQKIKSNETLVNDYRKKEGKVRAGVKINYNRKVYELEQKNLMLKTYLRNFEKDRSKKLEEFKKEFNEAMGQLI